MVFELNRIEELLHGRFVGEYGLSIAEHFEEPSVAMEG
jgi:hypothetical protein